jgi:hypothetical protein
MDAKNITNEVLGKECICIGERAQLADLICTCFADLKPQDAVQLRIRAANLIGEAPCP